MKKILTILAVFAFSNSIYAQLITDNTITVEEAVNEYLLGEGIEAFNVTFNGFDAAGATNVQIGSFDATGTVLGMDEGLLLASGGIDVAEGPNTSGTSSSPTINPGSGCPDLNALIPGFTLNDRAILEFDFIPAGDTVRFNYIWGSEEYPEFVNSSFNDVFGFFISGPGIEGTFTDDAINIAVIPGTTMPVTIDNVNAGLNSEYYVDNTGTPSTPEYIQFDGYTVPLQAIAAVQCGEVYHIKIALADAGDSAYDSGVFLEKGSFTSNVLVDVVVDPVVEGIAIGGDDFTSGIIAGCSDAQFCMFRPDTTETDTAYFTIGGSATPGVQYILPSDSIIIFPPGVDTVCVDIISVANDLGAQVDSLTITTQTVNACGDTLYNSASIAVYNEYSYEVNAPDVTIDCPTEIVEISGSASGGISPYSYEWSLGTPDNVVASTQNAAVEPPEPGASDTYILTVTDACGLATESTTMTVTSNVQPDPLVFTSPNDTINCIGQSVNLTATGSLGQGELTYSWSTGDESPEISVTPGGSDITWYYVSVTDECGITATDSVAVYFIPLEAPIADAGPSQTFNCIGQEIILDAGAEGGAPPYNYQWSGFEPGEIITVIPEDTTTYYLTVTDDCGGVSEIDSVVVYFVPLEAPVADAGANQEVICAGDEVTLMANATGGATPYIYQWTGFPQGQEISVAPMATQTYFLSVTDNCGGVSQIDSVTVTVPIYDPITVEIPEVYPPCPGDEVVISANISGGAGGFEYEWNVPEAANSPTFAITPLSSANYNVMVTDQCGASGAGNFTMILEPPTPVVVTPATTPSCTGESFTLSVADIQGGAGDTPEDYFYTWTGPVAIDSTAISADGTLTINNAEVGDVFTLWAYDICGNYDTTSVEAQLIGVEFIPNVITPNNGDNINDQFVVPSSSVFQTKVIIMDRWGKVVLENDNYVCDQLDHNDPYTLINENCWDGKDRKGDVFYYMIDIDQGTCTFQGTLHILDNN